MKIAPTAVCFVVAFALMGCNKKPAETTTVSAGTASGASAPAGTSTGPIAATNAAELQRIQNDEHLTPQQKAEAVRKFTAQQK